MTHLKNSAYLYSELVKRERYFKIATFTAFLASSLFVVGFFAGNIKFWTWDSDQAPYGILGILITLAVTGFQRTLYSQGDAKKGKYATIFAFFLSFSFGMMTEVGGGMEREEARMIDKSISSPVFQGIMSNIGSISGTIGSNPYASNIAEAEATKAVHVLELNRCDRHSALGAKRVERCRVYEQKKIDAQQSKIAAYKQMASGADTQRSTALTESLSQAKSFERDEQNHHPLVKFIKDRFTIPAIFASFILSALIIGVFEYAFHYQGSAVAELRNLFINAGYDLSNGQMAPAQAASTINNVAAPAAQPTPQATAKQEQTPSSVATQSPAAATPEAIISKPMFNPLQAVASAVAASKPTMSKQYSATSAAQTYKVKPTTTPTGQVGHTEALSSTPTDDQAEKTPAKQIGFIQDKNPKISIAKPTDAAETKAEPEKAATMSAPEAKALLSTINNAKFDEVFVAIATGETKTAIGAARKKHGTGAEQVQNTLVCLEYCGLVSPKNDNGQRTVTETIDATEAEVVMEEIKKIIRGAAA